MMDYPEALAFLNRRDNRELGSAIRAGKIDGLSLAPILAVLDVCGNPQRCAPVIHITGTNGKGTVAEITTKLILAAGLRVGTFTSPHLVQVNERIVIDGEPIADEVFAQTVADVAAYETLAGQELSCSHVRAAVRGVLRAVARPIHRGRTVQVFLCEVFN